MPSTAGACARVLSLLLGIRVILRSGMPTVTMRMMTAIVILVVVVMVPL